MNIRHIAEKAGVSVATVSRVLNHPENVAEKTRAKIEQIMKEEEYTPNWFARGLNFNKTGTIGVMIPQVLNQVYMEMAKGVEDVAHQKGYISFMCNAEEDVEKERRYLELLIHRRVDGLVLLCSCLEEQDFKLAEEAGVPVVLVGGCKYNPGLNLVSVNFQESEKKATDHLIHIGYRRIALLYGNASGVENEEKIQGYKKALLQAQHRVEERYLMQVENSIEGGYLGAKKLVEMKQPPEAILTTSDMIAFGVMEAIKDQEKRIPEDIAVVGFDNVRMSNLVEPKLTTVDIPLHKMGIYGARLLFDMIESEEQEEPKTILLQTKMKIRKSCGHKDRIGEMF